MPDERAPWEAPVRALAAYLAERGEQITGTRRVSDRRGSRAWQVVAANGRYALKANAEGGHAERDKRAELDREARVIAELARLAAIPSGYLVGAGHWEAGRWLAVTWAPGTPMWNALAPARHHGSPHTRRLLTVCARSMASAGAALHAAGWAHADIQPTNTLVTEDGTATLIDYALACGPVTPGRPDLETHRVPYRGALTHTTAPEIAQAVLDTSESEHIPVAAASDVWALGASLFWCWTGLRPVPYREPNGPRQERLRDIAAGITHDLALVRPWPFPAFEEALMACLHPDPHKRPTSGELTALLEGMTA
ncbi:protein kinase domain-containing protein [Streptomyces asiaticus]